MGSIKPTGEQGALDAAVKAGYDRWKAAYVKPLCGGYVVKAATTPHPIVPNPTTNSTALGNGMVITAMMAGHDPEAQTIFDGMFAVARKFPSILSHYVPPKHGIGPRANNQYLLAYAIAANCAVAFDDHSEVNGDLIFAYALAVADKQWGSAGKVNYLDELRKTANAIKLYDMSTLKTPLIGDWATLPGEGMWTTVTKPQNFMVGTFRAFAKASGDVYWMEVIDAIQALIADVQMKYSPMTGLFSRYLIGSRNLPGNTVLNGNDINARDHFGDVGPLPLWLAADYIGSADARTKAALSKITDWLKTKTAGDPAKIVDGYRLNGDNIGTRGTMAFVAPFGAIAAFDAGNQTWLDAIWKLMSTAPTTSEPADTANVLGMLMVTGNWWQP
jgi:endoglucanase